jgi:hypothetical protein
VKAPKEARREEPAVERERSQPAAPAGLLPVSVLQMQRTAGNQAVQRILRRPAGPVLARRPYVLQAAYMSGDMFGIAASLVLDPACGVLILKESDPRFQGTREDQSDLYKAFYEASLRRRGVREDLIRQRVKVVTVADTRAYFKDLTADDSKHRAAILDAAGLTRNDHFRPPGFATGKVGEAFEADRGAARGAVRQAFTGGGGPTDRELEDFLTAKLISRGQKYALLWIRLSGKRKSGGAHPELDTSIQGVRDLKAAITAQTGRQVVLVGDRPGKADVLTNAIDMIEFWKQPPFAAYQGLAGRQAQLKLFEFMVRRGYDLVSIGMRSGAMEGPALLGVPTVYIEEAGNVQHERMEKWKDKVPGWTQASVAVLPTRTGKHYLGAGMDVPSLERAAADAVGAVSRKNKEGFEATRVRLQSTYTADYATFQRAFVEASIYPWWLPRGVTNYDTFLSRYANREANATWWAELQPLLADWHTKYGAERAALAALDPFEQRIATLTGQGLADVRRLLRDTPGAADTNIGLGDFAREAVVRLTVPGVAANVLDEVRVNCAKWRSAWIGKAELAKGFSARDVALILDTPELKRDRFEKVKRDKAALLGEIDTLVSEAPGTAARRLDALLAQPRITADAFRNGYLDLALAGLRRVLKLAVTAPREAVQVAFIAHIKTTTGAAWWEQLTTKLHELHGALFPA